LVSRLILEVDVAPEPLMAPPAMRIEFDFEVFVSVA
jgi:hypothetical protein